MSFKIIGTGKAHPAHVMSNDDFAKMVETNDEWISTRTGIKNRYICTNETLLDLSAAASKDAIAHAGIKATELDLIICSTVQGDYVTPALSCLIQKELDANCPAFDINAACSGFIYALNVAAAFLDSGRSETILVVSAEMMTKQMDWSDRETCVLFGDGAGAVVLTKGNGLRAIRVTTKGDEKLLYIGGSTGNNPYSKHTAHAPYLHMMGREVFKFAVNSMCRDITEVIEEAGLEVSQITKVIPHQANLRIIRAAAERLALREDQIVIGIDRYGNTSSASIPILLSELFDEGKLKKGDIIVLSAFGGGLTTGACVIEL